MKKTLVEQVKAVVSKTAKGFTYKQMAKRLGLPEFEANTSSMGRAVRTLRKEGVIASQKVGGKLTFFPSGATQKVVKAVVQKVVKKGAKKGAKKGVKKVVVALGINPNLKSGQAFVNALEKAIAKKKSFYTSSELLVAVKKDITRFLKQ